MVFLLIHDKSKELQQMCSWVLLSLILSDVVVRAFIWFHSFPANRISFHRDFALAFCLFGLHKTRTKGIYSALVLKIWLRESSHEFLSESSVSSLSTELDS